ASSLVGGDFTAGSIVIVFHMFTMQRWLDRCQRALDDAARAARSTGIASMDRSNARRSCEEVRRAFPFIQVISLGVAIVVMCALAALAGWEARSDIPIYHTMAPALILLLLYLVTAYAYRREGLAALDEALAYLGVDECA